jgi:SDR family mycofactocin-dependent oxidoreductase
MGRLEGSVAFVTGGARGIGRAVAEKLAGEGADIVICDICRDVDEFGIRGSRDEDIEETIALVEARGRHCHGENADVRDQAALDRVVRNGIERFGKIDLLVANAGGSGYGPFWTLTEEEWLTHIDINLNGAWRSAKAVAPHMIERLSGSIVFIASVRSVLANWNYAHYIAAKHGVLGLMKCVALELGPYGIRANAVLPGITDTPANDNPLWRSHIAGREISTREDWLDSVSSQQILRGRRALPAAAIANAVLWLASDEAEHVTGLQMVVDAGHTIVPFAYGPVRGEDGDGDAMQATKGEQG